MIVIAILGILASLLQPTMKKIISSATTLTCAQNLHNFYNATNFYYDDNDGYFVPYAWRPKDPKLKQEMWFELLEQYHDRLAEARICPSTSLKTRGGWGSTTFTWNWRGYHGSYAFNSYFHSVYYRWGNTLEEMPAWFPNLHFIKMQNVKFPSSTGMITDSSWVDAWPRNHQGSSRSAAIGGQARESSMGRIAVNRHDWATNVLKADGSVGYHKLEELWSKVYWNLNDKPRPAPKINP